MARLFQPGGPRFSRWAKPLSKQAFTPPDYGITWYTEFSQPTLRKPFQAESLFEVFRTNVENFVSVESTTPYRKVTVVQNLFQPVIVAAELTPKLSWYSPLSIPTRRINFLEGCSVYPLQELVPKLSWYKPLAEPTRRKLLTEQYSVYPLQELVPFLSWYRPLAEPTRRKLITEQFAVYPLQELVPFLSWYRSLSEPTRRKTFLEGCSVYPLQELVPFLSWYKPLSEPTRKITFQEILHAFTCTVPSGEVITLDKWYNSLSEPTKRKVFNDLVLVVYPATVPTVTPTTTAPLYMVGLFSAGALMGHAGHTFPEPNT